MQSYEHEFIEKQQQVLKNFRQQNRSMSQTIVAIIAQYIRIVSQHQKIKNEAYQLQQYNKRLLQLIQIFRQHQKKLIARNTKMEEVVMKYAKEHCLANNKTFQLQNYKPTLSIFDNFSIVNKIYQKQQIQNSQTQIFSQDFLQKLKAYLPSLEQKVLMLEQQIKYLQSQLFQKNEKIQSKIKDIDTLLIKYHQMEQALQQSQRINRNKNLEFQQFINSTKMDEIKDSALKMEQQIFYLQKQLKTKCHQLQQQKNYYEKIMVNEIVESQILIKKVLQQINKQSS